MASPSQCRQIFIWNDKQLHKLSQPYISSFSSFLHMACIKDYFDILHSFLGYQDGFWIFCCCRWRKQVVKGGVSLFKQKYLLLHNVGRCHSQVLLACWTLNNQGFYVLIFTLV